MHRSLRLGRCRKNLPLSDMASTTLIDDAIHDRRSWKKIGAELDALTPDPGGAQLLMDAYRNGSCQPWMAAFLLGCVGDPIGYETALEILLSDAGSSSASYASVAMAKMRGDAAYPDLRNVLMGDGSRKVRQGAVYGMEKLQQPQLLDDLYVAHRNQKLSRQSASWHIAYCNPSDQWLTERLTSDELDEQKLGCAVVDAMVRSNTPMDDPGYAISILVQSCLSDTELTMMASRRKSLLEWTELMGG
ncbi:hypothetical protein [Neorhodopirellula lusitana]|uniref:hypothetical protein n=1 Tax=Neorhodopirellula lusitana TaxID=445327 RepID=UPI003850FA79